MFQYLKKMKLPWAELCESSPVGYLEGIYVKAEFRNKGIAKELVEYAWVPVNGVVGMLK